MVKASVTDGTPRGAESKLSAIPAVATSVTELGGFVHNLHNNSNHSSKTWVNAKAAPI